MIYTCGKIYTCGILVRHAVGKYTPVGKNTHKHCICYENMLFSARYTYTQKYTPRKTAYL